MELHPSEIARYFELEECSHYFSNLLLRKRGELQEFEPIIRRKEIETIELAKWGDEFELSLLQEFKKGEALKKLGVKELPRFYGFLTENDTPVRKFFEKYFKDGIIVEEDPDKLLEIINSEKSAVIYQAPLKGRIGKFDVSGRADFIIKVGKTLYLLEAKFTKEEKFYHRIQAIIYAHLLSQMIEGYEIKLAVVTKENFPIPSNFLRFPGDVEELKITLEEKLGGILREQELWIDARCTTCPFEALCLSKALEERSLGLLSLPPGIIRILKEEGIKDLKDMAKLFEFKENSPTNFEEPSIKDPKKTQEIAKRTGINLLKLSRIAQAILKYLDEGETTPLFIPRTGYNLPMDERVGDVEPSYYPPRSLVKVFFYVQTSPITDTIIGISALVKNRQNGERIIVKFVDEPPIEVSDAQEKERMLLIEFFRDVIDAVKSLSPTDKVYLHMYFYNRKQRDDLMDAVKRHKEIRENNAVMALLSLRRAIDWESFSIIKDEIIRRHALPLSPGLGFVTVATQFGYRWRRNKTFARMLEVVARRENGKINLKTLLNISETGIGPEYYPIIDRDNEGIPFTLFWSALVKLATEEDNSRIKRDIRDILSQMVEALKTIEERIPEQYKDAFVKKEGIPKEDLENFDIKKEELADILLEYLQLEFDARFRERSEYYRLPLSIRAYSEESALIKIENIEKKKNDCLLFGKIVLIDENGRIKEYNPKEVLIDIDEGSLVVVTPKKFLDKLRRDPVQRISKSPLGIVEAIDHETGKVVIRLIRVSPGRFTLKHSKFSCKNGLLTITYPEGEVKVTPGEIVIVDPSVDDIGMERAYNVLSEISQGELKHEIYQKVKAIYEGNTESRYEVNIWKKKHIEEFLSRVKKINEEQKKFAIDINNFLVTLQGPPGTGKTSGAIAPAILARAYSMVKDKKNGLFVVTGVSHRAVNEALIKTLKLKKELENTLKELRKIDLIRAVSGEEAIKIIKEELEREIKDDVDRIRFTAQEITHSSKQRSLDKYFANSGTVRIVFGTPQTLNKLMKNTKEVELVVIDEASMMDLPMFFLSTKVCKGQVLLVGDHRQMEPIQVHEWQLEDRKTFEEHYPFLSALNFIRFLRGELDERELKKFKRILGREPPEWKKDKNEVLPLYRLVRTYRLPQEIADLLSDAIYRADGIKLISEKKKRRKIIARHKDEFLSIVLDDRYPFVLILHDEGNSTKINELEAKIVEKIIKRVENIDIGVVVPYRAQKRLIASLIDSAQVDTVERFQGGEKSLIVISMTSSDPAYLGKVFDFLFNPNRLNVAISRAKEKVIFIASKNIFTYSVRDLEMFELLRPWKKIYIEAKRKGEHFEFPFENHNLQVYRIGRRR
ncbi:DNA helicase [Pyrococcus furiosus DSM 3638]|uniref:DNA helicase n=2 Tax=Pyrococcus furiosus TaxID=2261 RepID=A0A5C0XM34_PYRFU|nr:DNA helicase [Pyrococcus furiosus COM1]QEK77817.1 DNA helicase [Pyrococcus furiosus DSM 3638]